MVQVDRRDRGLRIALVERLENGRMLAQGGDDPVGRDRPVVLDDRDPVAIDLIGRQRQGGAPSPAESASCSERSARAARRGRPGVRARSASSISARRTARRSASGSPAPAATSRRAPSAQVHAGADEARRRAHHPPVAFRRHARPPVRIRLPDRFARRGQRQAEPLDEFGNRDERAGGQRTVAKAGDHPTIGPWASEPSSPVIDRPGPTLSGSKDGAGASIPKPSEGSRSSSERRGARASAPHLAAIRRPRRCRGARGFPRAGRGGA